MCRVIVPLYQSCTDCRTLLCQLWKSQLENSVTLPVGGHMGNGKPRGEDTLLSWLGGLWCYQPYCFATVFCQSYDDFSGEIEAFWVHPNSLHILLPDYRPGRYCVLHRCQLLDTGAQESSSLYMRFLIHCFHVLRAHSWWLVASFLEGFRARTLAHRPPLLPASSPWNAFILGDCPFTWSYWPLHSPTPLLPTTTHPQCSE